MSWIPGTNGPLVPYMNEEGPSSVQFDDTTRPEFAIGDPVRIKWIVLTGFTPVDFNLYFYGVRANVNIGHTLIQVVDSADWTADGTVSLFSETFDIYYTDISIPDIVPGLYSICLNTNSRHYQVPVNEANGGSYYHDGAFELTPSANLYYDDLPERTELHSRIAGRKARYPDETVIIGQVESGYGIGLKYRTLLGVASGYSDDPTRQSNIIFECTLEFGTDVVSGANLSTGEATSWASPSYATVQRILFSDEFDWVYDNANTRVSLQPADEWAQESIPVHFKYYESPTGRMHFSARAAHTGLFAAHDDGVTRTVMTPGTEDPHSIGHIEFLDTVDGAWIVVEGEFEGPLGWRRGISVAFTPTAASFSWVISDGVNTRTVLDGETLLVAGTNGVSVLVDMTEPLQRLTIDRPLQMQEDDVDVGDPDTVTINYETSADTTNHTELLRTEVVDDTAGKRTISVYGRVPSDTDAPPSLTMHWRYDMEAAEINGLTMYPGNQAQVIGDFVVNRANYGIGPYGQYTAGDVLLVNHEIITQHGLIFEDPGANSTSFHDVTKGGNNLITPEHTFPRAVKVTEAGLYEISTTTQGMQHIMEACLNGGNGFRHLLQYHVVVMPNGIEPRKRVRSLDMWMHEAFGLASGLSDDVLRARYNSIPWSLQGTLRLWLEADDWVYLVIHSRLSFNWMVYFTPAYHWFEIKRVTTVEPDEVNLPAHGLEGMRLASWENMDFEAQGNAPVNLDD